jgi:LCP family protein required for cell wall assembly
MKQGTGRAEQQNTRLKWMVMIIIMILALAAGIFVFRTVRNMVAGWSDGKPSLFSGQFGSQSDADPQVAASPTAYSLEETPEPWDGTERITVLLMGLDYRDWQDGNGPPRTDTMMLVSIDPVSRSAGMLSIPRDLWVEIPGFEEHNRINTAYFLGESYKLPGGGPGLAMKTVENLLGVPIQYYAVIEFSAFERMIDEIGGIDVLVKQRMKISPIGRMSKWLEAKPYHLDGAETLAYARARKTEGGDFDRAARQQQVALAIRDRVLGFDMIPQLVARAPALYNEVKSGVKTNFMDPNASPGQFIDQIKEAISLLLLALDIPLDSVHKGVIAPPDMVSLVTLPDGAQVLKPAPDQIRMLRDEIFTMSSAIGPSISDSEPASGAQQEVAKLAVLNGAGVEGLAGQTAQYLEGQGLTVAEVGNADRLDYAKTMVIDYTNNPYTRQFLMTLMDLTEGQILNQFDASSEIDMALILGADWSLP